MYKGTREYDEVEDKGTQSCKENRLLTELRAAERINVLKG